jgi:hypothetical protein
MIIEIGEVHKSSRSEPALSPDQVNQDQTDCHKRETKAPQRPVINIEDLSQDLLGRPGRKEPWKALKNQDNSGNDDQKLQNISLAKRNILRWLKNCITN